MAMGHSLFRLGLAIAVIGIGSCAYVFTEGQKTTEPFGLEPAQTKSAEQHLRGADTGFFRVYSPNFRGEAVFVQVVDPDGNIIADKKIETRMAVNYFEIGRDGIFTIKATNLSGNPIYFEIEYGQTNAEQLLYPGTVILAGVIIMAMASYRRLKDYSMAQPDENIS